MRYYIIILFTLCLSCKQHGAKTVTVTRSQKKHEKEVKIFKPNCGCASDSSINQYTTKCDTVVLKNNNKLYYQFNCDSIWLTFENKSGHKKILYQEKEYFKELYGYQYRIKYVLRKEYKKSLLFRTGCPANGPCNFVLIDKNTGRLKTELGELIYQHNPDIFYDFIIYFNDDYKSITVDFIDTGRKIKKRVKKEDFNSTIPEYQFDKIDYKNGMITLIYDKEKMININLNKP